MREAVARQLDETTRSFASGWDRVGVVRVVQVRRGMIVDGVVGPRTLVDRFTTCGPTIQGLRQDLMRVVTDVTS